MEFKSEDFDPGVGYRSSVRTDSGKPLLYALCIALLTLGFIGGLRVICNVPIGNSDQRLKALETENQALKVRVSNLEIQMSSLNDEVEGFNNELYEHSQKLALVQREESRPPQQIHIENRQTGLFNFQ